MTIRGFCSLRFYRFALFFCHSSVQRCNCHAKNLADFCFVGSSTLIATVGNGGGASTETGSSSHLIGGMSVASVPATTITSNSAGTYRFATDAGSSSGSAMSSSFGLEQNAANLALWDSLLPPHRCGVIRKFDHFRCLSVYPLSIRIIRHLDCCKTCYVFPHLKYNFPTIFLREKENRLLLFGRKSSTDSSSRPPTLVRKTKSNRQTSSFNYLILVLDDQHLLTDSSAG